MISQKMQDVFNEQIKVEIYSAYLYLSMAAYFEHANLSGFAQWMKVQAQEEMGHAMKFYKFILERGGKVQFKAIEAPPVEWKSALDAFQAAQKHEQEITSRIHKLVDIASAEKDVASGIFLQWFVTEQVEEESNADIIVKRLEMIKDSANGLFMLDHKLGERKASS
jgi:ferritin